jgi:pimeloyl-ACP methyl ester carboxylesterase
VGSGTQVQRAVLELRRSPAWEGSVHTMGRTLGADTLHEVVVRGDSVTFAYGDGERTTTVAGVLGEYGALGGTFTRGTGTRPFTFRRATPDPAAVLLGYWSGALTSGGAMVLRTGVEFAPAPCGQVYGTLDSPDQGTNDLPFTALSLKGDSLLFEMTYLDGAFRGIVSADRGAIAGSWTQGGNTLELQLTRGDSVTFRRPQEPVPPYPYDTVAVTYENLAGPVRFTGTLTLPQGEGPFPAVLLITGSGAQNRDETVMGHRPFLIIADYLTRRGIATLRVDDRGIGGSGGDVMTATIADNAGDALAGVAFLKGQQKIDPARIGLLGHSEGGWVAPLAATQSRDVAFIILLAGPAVTGREIRHAQDSVMGSRSGASLDYVTADRLVSSAIYDALEAEPNDSLALLRTRETSDAASARLTPAQRLAMDSAWAGVDLVQVWRPLATPWFRYLLAYDPRPVLAQVRVPVLALFGEKDVQVPPSQSVPAMRQAFTAGGLGDVTITVFPGLNHLFQHATTGLVAEYGQIEETVAPDVLETIGAWIATRFGTR